MQQSRDDRSLGELFSELAQETSTLVRQEVNLAKTEMSHKVSRDVRRDPNPLVDSVDGPEVMRSQIGPDPALGGGVGGGAVVDEAELERAEIERTRTEIERTRADMGETVVAIQERLSPENLE